MGQAKRRGTFEERKQQSLERRAKEREEMEEEEKKRNEEAAKLWNAMTPEQQQETLSIARKKRKSLGVMLGVMAMVAASSNYKLK